MNTIKNDIYFLNIQELKTIAASYDIPIHVYYREDGTIKQSVFLLRKKKIIKNIIKKLVGKDKPIKKFIIPEINVGPATVNKIDKKTQVTWKAFRMATMKKFFSKNVNNDTT